jgi:Transposase, Mutator family
VVKSSTVIPLFFAFDSIDRSKLPIVTLCAGDGPQDDWEAWNKRPLADEPIARLILDGTVVRVRLHRKTTSIALLVLLGVREDGQKVLPVKYMGGRDGGGLAVGSRRPRHARIAQASSARSSRPGAGEGQCSGGNPLLFLFFNSPHEGLAGPGSSLRTALCRCQFFLRLLIEILGKFQRILEKAAFDAVPIQVRSTTTDPGGRDAKGTCISGEPVIGFES